MKYDSAIDCIARRYGGVVPVAALRAEGLPTHIPALGLKQGWQRLWPGIYVPSAEPISFHHWVAAGRIAFGEEAALGSAAALFQIGLLNQEPHEILFWIPTHRRYRRVEPNGRLHVKRDCNGRLDRIPARYLHTGVVDSICDYLNSTPREIDAAGVVIRARKRWPEMASRFVDALAERQRLKHRWLAEELLLVSPAYDSPLEWLFMKKVVEPHGIEEPERQWRCPAGYLRDNAWPRLKAIVELDGDAFHTDKITVGKDRQKDRTALANGFVTLRFGYRDVVDNACGVVNEMRAAIPGLKVQSCASPLCASSLGISRRGLGTNSA